MNKCFTTSRPLVYFLQPLVATAVPLGVELSIDHEPGHSNIFFDGLSRTSPHTAQQLGPTLRSQCTLLHSGERDTNGHDGLHTPAGRITCLRVHRQTHHQACLEVEGTSFGGCFACALWPSASTPSPPPPSLSLVADTVRASRHGHSHSASARGASLPKGGVASFVLSPVPYSLTVGAVGVASPGLGHLWRVRLGI